MTTPAIPPCSPVVLLVTGIVHLNGSFSAFVVTTQHETDPKPLSLQRKRAAKKTLRNVLGGLKTTAEVARTQKGFRLFHATQRLRAEEEQSASGSAEPSAGSRLI